MNQGVSARTRQYAIVIGLSFLLSQMVLTNLLFTIPLLVLAQRYPRGERTFVPVGAVAVLLLVTELFRLRSALDTPVGRVLLLVGMFVPVVSLVSASIWIWLEDRRLLFRYLASASFGVVAALVLVIWFSGGSETVLELDASVLAIFQDFLSRFGAVGEGNALGSEMFSPAEIEGLYRTTVKASGAILVPFSMGMNGFASFVSLAIAGGRKDNAFAERVSRWRLPENTLWVFLGSWTVVLAVMFSGAGYLPRALALNIAFGCSLLYAVQGLAIVVHLVRKKSPAVNLGKLLMGLFLIVILFPGLNVLVVFVLPLLGVTETWIVYRKNV
jgi:heme/copper-type cytochrome/quinol oxidase subunit 4